MKYLNGTKDLALEFILCNLGEKERGIYVYVCVRARVNE